MTRQEFMKIRDAATIKYCRVQKPAWQRRQEKINSAEAEYHGSNSVAAEFLKFLKEGTFDTTFEGKCALAEKKYNLLISAAEQEYAAVENPAKAEYIKTTAHRP